MEWTTNKNAHFLHDADKIMDAFYHFCHLAGPSQCALYSLTAAEIESRFNKVLANLKIHPVIVPASTSASLPEVVTYSSIKRLISAALYRPIILFPPLARIIVALETGDGQPYLDVIQEYKMREDFSCSAGDPAGDYVIDDAFRAIMCSDGRPMTDDTKGELQEHES